MADKPTLFALMGPTASGKTGIALELAERHGFELISVDSVLVYRGLDIGSAKPSADELARAPHALVDIREFWQTYSAGEFRDDCQRLVAEITGRGNRPLLIGGTQLYYKALQDFNPDLPHADDAIRAQIRADADRAGWPALHARLASCDPVTAARLHPNHSSRIERALEVFELTGKPLSDFHVPVSSPYDMRAVALMPEDRAWLHRRIALRFEQMMAAG
ncbi:MAG: tRNA (adenosine(37)-N6)-dimethylallyltransferase MiaA, partial [Litorivicinus sp.]